MRRWFIVIWMMLIAVVSCMKERTEDAPAHDPDFPEGKPITITFTVPGIAPSTKALDNGGDLNNLYLAVFGSSGYLKEYVQADPISVAPTGTYQTVDAYGNPKVLPVYTFTATLAMTESARSIHFIGNGPSTLEFGYNTAVLPVLMSSPGEKAYWQMITLPNGIRAKKEKKMIEGKIVEVYVDKDDNAIPEGATTGYVPSEETAAAFQGIALIRNWAKIEVEAQHDPNDEANESNFTPISMAVVNKPARGTIVPYNSNSEDGFIKDYQTLSFTQLSEDEKYSGNLPSSTKFDKTVPPKEAFVPDGEGNFGEGVSSANGDAVFLYERPAASSSMQPSYVIIYGTFKDPERKDEPGYEGVNCFYKLDLVDTKKEGNAWVTNYFPVFRNFKYRIVINKILSEGQPSPALAALSAGSADVSIDVNASGVTEISDGTARMHIQPWMANTITAEHNENNPYNVLRVYFSKALGEGAQGIITAEPLPMEDGSAAILYNVELGDSPDDEGYWPITFCNKAPDNVIRSQKIRVTGSYPEGTLYRDIVITVQGKQPISVRCLKPYISKTRGTEQTVQFMIPDGLMQSMFPLNFIIEAEDMTLTPDNTKSNNNLPVISGISISENDGYAGKTAFQFRRTITWNDYIKLESYIDPKESIWRVVNCYFKTNREESATTVWVCDELGYFNKASDFFQNYGLKTFGGLTFGTPIPMETDAVIPVSFTMEKDEDHTYPEDFPQILFTAIGLICKDPGVSPGPTAGTYYYKPTNEDGTVNIDFITTTSDGDISLELTADEYGFASLVPCHFSHVGFVDGMPVSGGYSNVIFGHVNSNVNPANGMYNGYKTVLFAYHDDPRSPFVPITLRIGTGTEFDDESTYKDSTTPNFPYTPVENRSVGDLLYHEIPLRSGSAINLSPVYVQLSANGYVTKTIMADRFVADVNPMEGGGLSSKIKPGTTTTTLSGRWTNSYKCDVSIPSVSGSSGGVQLKAGLEHLLTVTSKFASNEDQTKSGLFLVRMVFATKNGKNMIPEKFLNEDGTEADVEKYMMNDNTYIWHIHSTPTEPLHEAKLKLVAPDDAEICMSSILVWDYRNTTFYPQ